MKYLYNIKYSSARCIKLKYELHLRHAEIPQAESDDNNWLREIQIRWGKDFRFWHENNPH